MGHTLQSFLVLRDVFLDVVNVARLYRLFLDFLDLGIAPLATFIFGVILLAQDLNLRGNRVVAYIALIGVVFFILSEQVLQVAIALAISRWLGNLGVVTGESDAALTNILGIGY